MATEVGDTLAPSDTSGSGVFGADTASVEGDNASKSTVPDTEEDILRLRVKGFRFGKGEYFWQDVVILRAGHRKVAIHLLSEQQSPLGRNVKHSLQFDLDRVILSLSYLKAYGGPPRCTLRETTSSAPYLLEFGALQDVFKFQEIFTGFSVQIHIPGIFVCFPPKHEKRTPRSLTAIQLWSEVPDQYESHIHAHDGLRARSHLPESGAKRDLPGHEKYPKSSDKGPRSVDSSVMKRPPSSLLVFSSFGLDIGAAVHTPLINIPPRKVRLVVDGAKTKHRQEPLLGGAFALAPALAFATLNPLLPAGMWSAYQLAKLSKFKNSIDHELEWVKWVELEFRDIKDERRFKAAFNALKDLHGSVYKAETHSPKRKSFGEPVTLTRHFGWGELGDWEISNKDNMIPPAKQASAKPESTPLHGVKAGLVDSPAPRSQPRRGLAGDSTNHPDGRADITPSVTASLNSKFRSQQGLAGNSTIHSDGRADMVPLVAGSLDFNSKFHGRSRSSDVLDADQQRSINSSYESSVGGMRRLRSTLMGHTGGKRRTPRIHSPQYAADIANISFSTTEKDISDLLADCTLTDVRITEKRPEGKLGGLAYATFATLEGLTKALDHSSTLLHDRHIEISVAAPVFLVEKGAFDIFPNITDRDSSIEATHMPYSGTTYSTSTDKGTKESNQALRLLDEPPHSETSAKAKQMKWQRRICRKLVLFMLWKWEQNDGVPKELWSSPASFEFITDLKTSLFDKIKSLFETYSGREWDWWPFDPPAKPLENGKVRIKWQCICGDQRWTDASKYLARKCQALVNENTVAGHENGNATSQSAGSAASHSNLGSVVPWSFPSGTSQTTGVTSKTNSTAQAGHIQETNKSSHPKDLYVLLCIYQGSQIHHSQILASKCQNDEAFFENLRQEYRRLRGFFRFWFSPLQFSHCDFVKFTRFYVNELAKVGHSLPIDLVYQYTPRPPGPHEDPPISPHEFRRRFYTHFANPCGRDEALERIPKRQKRFQVNLHVDGREDMWGLHVELRPSFLVVLMWQIVITAGGWAFMGWWLSRHQGDLQNAAVPVTLIVTAVMVLWAPIRKGLTEAL